MYGRLLKVLFHLKCSVDEFISNGEYSTVVSNYIGWSNYFDVVLVEIVVSS